MENYDPSNTDWEKLKRGLEKYINIMETFHSVNCETNFTFQKSFNGFYRIRQRPESFYKILYSYLEASKTDQTICFEKVLDYFYQNTGKIEASFSSKILATIKPDKPIWDSEVLSRLDLKKPGYHLSKNDRLWNTKMTYSLIEDYYEHIVSSEMGKYMLNVFNKKIPNQNLSKIKKIDLILWQTR